MTPFPHCPRRGAPRHPRAALRLGTLLLACALLAGCAAQRAHERGLQLLARGELAQGLQALETATRLEPARPAYRLAWLQARERHLQALVDEAQRLERQHRTDEARERWAAVLALDDRHERAQAALARPHPAPREPTPPATVAPPLDAAPEALPPRLREAYRKPIGLQFKDASLQSIFDVIARSSGLNILLDKDLRGEQKASIYLKDSTIERALSVLLLTQQLAMRVVDENTVLVYPNTAAKQKDYEALEVASFYLAHAEAKAVAATLKTLLKSQYVVVDEKLNLLIVRDSPAALHLARKLVALHDIAEPEVLLDVEIIEVKRSRLLNLGLRWPDQFTFTPLPAGSEDTLRLSDLRHLDSSRIGVNGAPLTLNLRKTDGDANILANPRIRARNREKAKILIGERVPNITATSTATGFVAESVTYVDVGLKLDVEPTVFLGDEVAIKVSLEVSNIINQVQTKQGSVAFQIGTRTAQTVLRLRDGERQLLAGLINDEDRRSANRVPGLGDLPVLGRLFGSQNDDQTKTEIVLSITPRVLRNVQPSPLAHSTFETGTDNALALSGPLSGGGPATAPTDSGGSSTGPSAATRTAAAAPSATLTGAAATATTNSAPASAAPPLSLQWEAPASVAPGETLVTTLRLQGAGSAGAWPLVLAFDPSALQPLSVASEAGSRIDPAGRVLLTTAAGAAALATLRWRALQTTGSTTLRVQALGARDANGQPLTIALPDRVVRIEAARTP